MAGPLFLSNKVIIRLFQKNLPNLVLSMAPAPRPRGPGRDSLHLTKPPAHVICDAGAPGHGPRAERQRSWLTDGYKNLPCWLPRAPASKVTKSHCEGVPKRIDKII